MDFFYIPVVNTVSITSCLVAMVLGYKTASKYGLASLQYWLLLLVVSSYSLVAHNVGWF